MIRIDITQAFLAFLDRASTNPLEVFDQLALNEFTDLDGIDLGEPDTISITSTSLTGTQGAVSVVFKGSGFSPATSFEAFSEALENGTARGTLQSIEVRNGGVVVFATTITANTLTMTVGDRQLELEGRFPTGFADVLEMLDAISEFGDEYRFVSPEDQARYDAIIARYDLSSMVLRTDGDTAFDIDLGADHVNVAIPQGLNVVFDGTFEDGLGGGLVSVGLVTSILGFGEFYEEDGITLNDIAIIGPDGDPFFTVTGDFTEGDLLQEGTLFVNGREMAYFDTGSGVRDTEAYTGTADSDDGVLMAGFGGNDMLTGAAGADILLGGAGNDRLSGLSGADTLYGGDGTDAIIGGDGNDMLFGGATEADLRDNIFGGDGDDTIDGGYGNDALRGDAGNDVIAGGFGADTVIGGTGNDTVTGSAFGDLLFGSDGDDFINGGFGFDQANGGAGADVFYHLGVAGHGTDFIQDFGSAEGDVLVFGNRNATRDQFQINDAFTANAGADDVAEAFVIYRPTGQIVWALIDGMEQDQINLRIGSDTFDLLG